MDLVGEGIGGMRIYMVIPDPDAVLPISGPDRLSYRYSKQHNVIVFSGRYADCIICNELITSGMELHRIWDAWKHEVTISEFAQEQTCKNCFASIMRREFHKKDELWLQNRELKEAAKSYTKQLTESSEEIEALKAANIALQAGKAKIERKRSIEQAFHRWNRKRDIT